MFHNHHINLSLEIGIFYVYTLKVDLLHVMSCSLVNIKQYKSP